MGAEVKCKAHWGPKVSEGTALLETEEILFRGTFRLRIPFKELKSIKAKDGTLYVSFADGSASFELGSQAEKWLAKIRNPKGLIDKLGIKADSRVAVLGEIDDEMFWRQLKERAADVTHGRPKSGSDVILLAAQTKADLKKLAALQAKIKNQGAIWVIWPKGKPELKEGDVMAAAKEADLVDVKVVKFSDTHSGLKVVIPVALRK